MTTMVDLADPMGLFSDPTSPPFATTTVQIEEPAANLASARGLHNLSPTELAANRQADIIVSRLVRKPKQGKAEPVKVAGFNSHI